MKLFACQNCNQLLYFENTSCAKCGHTVGYLPNLDVMSAVEPAGPLWKALADPDHEYRFCTNWQQHACNWMVPSGVAYCRSCEHNRTIPDLSDPQRLAAWIRLEGAKRRLVYSLLRFRLPLPAPGSGDPEPLVFDFLDDLPGAKVLTGHDNGIITLALREADDGAREQLRTAMNEPYRTLLGHFRHEVGHYYWDRLVRDGGKLEECRAIFGDERRDYNEARLAYYANGPLPQWQEHFVSAYATMHPWEDFAETWAHFLHIVDALEMATAFGLSIAPRIEAGRDLRSDIRINPYVAESAEQLIADWLPTTFAVNSINRSMGQPDLYPFVISPAVVQKLEFMRALVVRP